jgi:hypothetical protein
MIIGIAWSVWLAWFLALFFTVNGVVNIIGPKGMRDSFARWGYPSWFHLLNGALQIVIAVLLVMDTTRLLGLGLGVLLCLAIFATLIRHHEAAHLLPSIVLLLVILVTAYGWTAAG